MEVKAAAKFIRMSPRKVRLVIDVVRGMNVDAALTQLKHMKKAAALPVIKVIESAKANAEHNFQLDQKTLVIKTITADGGPIFHRWKPRAMGRANPIRKRTTHINVVLEGTAISKAKTATKKSEPKKETKKSDQTKTEKVENKAEKKVESK